MSQAQRFIMQIENLRKVKAGDRPSASQWNQIIEILQELRQLLQVTMDRGPYADMFIGELQEDAAGDATGFEVQEMIHDSSSGGLTSIDITREDTAEIQNGMWLEDERLPLYWERSAGAYCIMPMVQVHFGKMDADIGAGENKLMSVWKVNASGDWADTGKNILVYDWLLKQGSVIASGKKVIVAQFLQSRRFIIIAAECP